MAARKKKVVAKAALAPGSLTKQLPKGLFPEELGSSGLDRSGIHVNAEFLRELRGRRKWFAFREFGDNDPVAAGMLTIIEAAMGQMDWAAEPSDDGSPEAELWAERVGSMMNDMEHPWQHVPRRAARDLVTYGVNLQEVVGKTRGGSDHNNPKRMSAFSDGLIGWRKFAHRNPETIEGWHWDEENDSAIGVIQQVPSTGARTTIPLRKCLHAVYNGRFGNPEGTSALRGAYVSYRRVERLRNIEGIGFDRNVSGMPIMTTPMEVFQAALMETPDPDLLATYNECKLLVQQIKRDEREGALMPPEFELDVDGNKVPTGYSLTFARLESAAQGLAALHVAIVRLETHMARTLMAEFMMMGSADAGGAFAMHADKTSMFALFLEYIADIIEASINQGPLRVLMELNNVPRHLWPKITHKEIRRESMVAIGQFVTQMVTAGLLAPSQELENHLIKIAGFPVGTRDEKDGI